MSDAQRSTDRVLPRAVFWDMDGTLLDTEPIWDTALEELCRRHGLEMTESLRKATLGNNSVDALTKVFDAARIPESGRDFDGEEAWMVALVRELFQRELPWRPGARETLDLLGEAEIPLLLVTNTMREVADVAIGTVGAERFVATVCGDEVAVGKPAPDIYLRPRRSPARTRTTVSRSRTRRSAPRPHTPPGCRRWWCRRPSPCPPPPAGSSGTPSPAWASPTCGTATSRRDTDTDCAARART